jgi:hypothetical protein
MTNSRVITNSSPDVGRNILSSAYLEAKNLLPRPSEWKEGGRPIYDRLPSASEAYKSYFYGDESEGLVYIGQNVGSNGPGSLEVVSSEDRESILIFGGTSLWKYGSVTHQPVVINLKELGMQSTKYLIAYRMSYDDFPREIFEDVEDYPISGIDIEVTSTTDAIIGWRHPAENIFSYNGELFWSSEDTYFPPGLQPANSTVAWENDRGFFIRELRAIIPATFTVSSDVICDLFVDEEFISSSYPSDRSFSFFLDDTVFGNKWELRWGSVPMQLQEIRMSGSFPSTYRPKTTKMFIDLVAYPAYEYPPEFAYCKLAYVDIDENHRVIGSPVDLRSTILRDYQPVAEWLTRPWDDLLKGAYDLHEDYGPLRMNPVSAMHHEYGDLENLGIRVKE